MSQHKDGIKIIGQVIAEEYLPGTDILVSREVGENIITKYGADSITNAMKGIAYELFNYMAISAATDAEARATATVPGSMTPTITKFMSTVITPTVVNGASTSIITWVFTFAAASGRTAIAQFGMELDDTGTSHCLNQYKFTAVKDNTNNDLKLTYNVSVAP